MSALLVKIIELRVNDMSELTDLELCKKIVKTVNFDNLPHRTERILVFLRGVPSIGYLRNFEGDTWYYTLCATRYAKLTSSDKYIEQKDLLELFE